MEEHYLSKNTDSLNRKANHSPNSSSIVAKQKLYNTQSTIAFLSLLMLFLLGNKMNGQTATVTISTTGTGTWTVPAGVTGSITVEAWGAGGSGGGASGKYVTGSGGTGGTYVSSTFTGVVAGTSYNLYVAPQTATGTSGANGNNGLASWFNSNLILNANGGLGGKSSNGAAVTAATTGSIGTTKIAGGSSLSAASFYYGTAGGAGGNGGGAGGANSTSPSNNSTDAGNPGSTPGGGGGGGATGGGGCGCSTTGGAGARGEIRITYTCPVNTIANAGSNQTLAACATTTTLAANTPTYGTGTWSVVSGTATITASSSPTSGVTGLVTGTTATLRWTIANGVCGSSTSDITITTSIGPSCLDYCTVAAQNGGFNDGITKVQFNTINNSTSANAGNEYNNYTGTSTTVTQGTAYNLSVYVNTAGAYTQYQRVWFDWNSDGDFDDAGEAYDSGSATNVTNGNSSLCPLSIIIPVTSATGSVRMRASSRYNTYANPCDTAYDGEIEDYTVIINPAPPCVAPTTQPTTLVLTPGGTSIGGSFTAAPAPIPQSYLVVMNSTGTAPTGLISNGTTYTIGSSIGVGNTVVDTDTNTTFTAGGLNNLTTYYFFIYSMNNLCTSGPLYNKSPIVLIGNATTTAATTAPCVPVTTSPQNDNKYISRVAFIGTLNDTNNPSTYSNATPGYQNFTTLPTKAIQAQGEGVNLIVESTGGRAKLKAWIDWNKDGDYNDSGEFIYGPNSAGISSTFGFIIPSGAVPGNYRIRVRTYNSFYNDGNAMNGNPDEYFGYNFDSCEPFNGGTYGGFATTEYGEAEDYLFTVIQRCDANILTVTDGQVCGSGSVTLAATATAGTAQYRWYSAATGGAQLTGSPTASGSWVTPSIAVTTTFYVTAWNGTCESLVRKPVIARVNPIPTLGFTPAAPEVCGENTVLTLTATGDKQQFDLINEKFEGGSLGEFSNINTDGNTATVDNQTKWTNRISTYIPNGNSWMPAISSGLAPNKFVLATSDSQTRPTVDVENSLTTGVLNSTGYLNLTLDLKFYYSRYLPDGDTSYEEYVKIQISTNGGIAWTDIQGFTADTGIGTQFASFSYPLNAYINQTNLKIRVLHRSWANATGMLPDGVAIDDVRLYGDKALNTAFNWSGASLPDVYTDASCKIAYTPGTPVATVYVKPTLSQLEMGTYTFTASAALANGCVASTPITITNKSKIWKGTDATAPTDWSVANNWLPAVVPTASTCVIIPAGKTSQIMNTPDAFAKTVTIKAPTGNLELQSGKNLTVTDNIIVETGATFNVRNNASLVQINNVANTGIVNVERNSTPIKKLDYTYWSSPVSGFTLGQFSTANSYMYSWLQTVSNSTGNWQTESDATMMTPGKGYIIRTPWGHAENTAYPAKFSGTPNNGDIKIPIYKGNITGTTSTPTFDGTDEDDEWNLIGNPYPSGLDIGKFLDLPANLNVVDGTVYIWMHNTAPKAEAPDPFYGDYALNYTSEDYATVNKTGGTAIASTSIAGTSLPSEFIPSCQSFFIKANNDMANGKAQEVTFNNDMRVPGKNSNFSKIQPSKEAEKNRIWLNLTNNSGAFSQILVGYLADATQGLDRGFDGESLGGNDVTFYSIIPEAELTIQGRALPFDENDQVLLGYISEISGELSIRIDHIDGLFDSHNIYLEDKELDVIHNLKEKPYVFNTEKGDFNDRFVLRFTDKTLGTDTFSLSKSNEVIVVVNQNVTVQSSNQMIKNIVVYDLSGRKIDGYKKVNALKHTLTHLNKKTIGLIVKITLENDTVVSKKIIF